MQRRRSGRQDSIDLSFGQSVIMHRQGTRVLLSGDFTNFALTGAGKPATKGRSGFFCDASFAESESRHSVRQSEINRENRYTLSPSRIALANLRFPDSPEESLPLVAQGIDEASEKGARIICFPECFVPGYRIGKPVPSPDSGFLERAWTDVAAASARANITTILGTERFVDGALRLTALVINADGSIAGFQDKVQLDPSEDGTYSAGSGRHVFQSGPVKFGIVICHEGWRYPETVRQAARQGAHIVFHPHFGEAEGDSFRPVTYADPVNTFHEKAALCRAAENTCYFATVNCASPGSPTTSAVVRPDGTLLCYQPYGEEGLLIADIDLGMATGFLARRCKSIS